MEFQGFLGGILGGISVSPPLSPPNIVPTEPVPPDVTFGVRWDPPEGDGDPQTPREGDPKTLLLFLFLRHRDPFGGYDAGRGEDPDFGGVPKLWGCPPGLSPCFRGVPKILEVPPRFWGCLLPPRLHPSWADPKLWGGHPKLWGCPRGSGLSPRSRGGSPMFSEPPQIRAAPPGMRRLLLPQLDPLLRLGRPALARGLRTLLHPLLGGLHRQHQVPAGFWGPLDPPQTPP